MSPEIDPIRVTTALMSFLFHWPSVNVCTLRSMASRRSCTPVAAAVCVAVVVVSGFADIPHRLPVRKERAKRVGAIHTFSGGARWNCYGFAMRRMAAAFAMLFALFGCEEGAADEGGEIVLVAVGQESVSACAAGVACRVEADDKGFEDIELEMFCRPRAELLSEENRVGFIDGAYRGSEGACEDSGQVTEPIVWGSWVCEEVEACVERWSDHGEDLCEESLDPAGRC